MIIYENLQRMLYIADIYRRDGNYYKTCELLIKVAKELAKPIDFPSMSAIIEEEKRYNHKHDKLGRFDYKDIVILPKKEYGAVCHSIATNHPEYKEGSEHCCFYNSNFYVFRVIMEGTYRFYCKKSIDSEEIDELRRIYNENE